MKLPLRTPRLAQIFLAAAVACGCGCAQKPPADRVRVSGQVEATDVQVAAPVGGRLLELRVAEGDRVAAGAIVAQLDTADAKLALSRARRPTASRRTRSFACCSPARGWRTSARPRRRSPRPRPTSARPTSSSPPRRPTSIASRRCSPSNSGSRKQRDDAVTRRDVAKARAQGARDRVRAARETVARLRAGRRREDIDAARARVAAADAQIATWEKAIADATVTAPVAGIVTEKLADVGELLQPRAPIVVLTDLDHAWANVYVDEPVVPRLRLGQPATVFTDAGGAGLPGTVSYISSKAEFTPRNVQTAEDRSKLVYRVKVSVNNAGGTLKAGMPVEAEIPFADAAR